MKYYFYSTCVGWPEDAYEEGGLMDMIRDSKIISRRTFLLNVGATLLSELAKDLGYAAHPKQGLTMARDWHISYRRSKLHGHRVYYVLWSGIEHVFVPSTFRLVQ